MSTTIRDYNPTTDAESVAALYNRNSYGPSRAGRALSGPDVNAVLLDRGVRLFLVAEDRGAIVGTIGYAAVSGRRVAGPGELFAGLFLIDPSFRSGLVAGNLFTTSFARLLEDGVTSLRVEVDPANTRALPIYVRVGFRTPEAIPNPDQDGYIELVSHLPGVVSRLLAEFASDIPVSDIFSSFSLRTMVAARKATINDGVVFVDGEAFVDHEFAVRGESIRVRVRMSDGVHVSTTVDGRTAVFSVPADGRHADSILPVLSRNVGDHIVRINRFGVVSVHHESYVGPLFVDGPPSVDGSPLGSRRPRRSEPFITETSAGWVIEEKIDGVFVQRRLTFQSAGILAETEAVGSVELTLAPWCGVRGALIRVDRDGDVALESPNVPGIWPPELVDFEASVPREPLSTEMSVLVDGGSVGQRFAFRWELAEWLRWEGQPLPSAGSTGTTVRYRLLFEPRAEAAPGVEAYPSGLARVESPEHLPDEPGSSSIVRWADRVVAGHPAVAVADLASDSELVLVPDVGIVAWRVDGQAILASPFPSARSLGPIMSWNCGLWVSNQGAREDPEQGVEWGVGSRLTVGGSRSPSWTVEPTESDLSSIRIVLDATTAAFGTEVVAHMVAKSPGKLVEIADPTGGWWSVAPGGRRWRLFTRAARFPLGGTKTLTVTAHRETDEILIRSVKDRLLLSLITRAGTTGLWSAHVETDGGDR